MKIVSLRPLMQHIIPSLFIAWGASYSSWATSPLPYMTEMEIKQEFKRLSHIKSLSAHFQQTKTVKEWQTSLVTSGKFNVRNGKDQEILWEVLKPAYTAVKLVPQGLFVKSSQKTQWLPIKNKKMAAEMKNVFSWLRFDLQKIQQDFDISKNPNKSFTLHPKKTTSHFKKIQLTLNKQDLVDSILMTDRDNDTLSIQFSKTQVTP